MAIISRLDKCHTEEAKITFLVYFFHAANQGHPTLAAVPGSVQDPSQNASFKDWLCDGNFYFCRHIDQVY